MNRRLILLLTALAAGFAVVVFAVPALAQSVSGPSNPTIAIPRVNIGFSPAPSRPTSHSRCRSCCC